MACQAVCGRSLVLTTSEALREHFLQCGTVESATVITDRYSGQSRGFGFVEMATNEEAQKAVSMHNGQRLGRSHHQVELANPQGAGVGGGGRGGQGGMGGGRGGSGRPPAGNLHGLFLNRLGRNCTGSGQRLGRAAREPPRWSRPARSPGGPERAHRS